MLFSYRNDLLLKLFGRRMKKRLRSEVLYSILCLGLVDKATTNRHNRWHVYLLGCLEMLYDLRILPWWRCGRVMVESALCTDRFAGLPSTRRAQQTRLTALMSSCEWGKRLNIDPDFLNTPFWICFVCDEESWSHLVRSTVFHSPPYRTSRLLKRHLIR